MGRGGMGGRGRYSHGTTDEQLIARMNREANQQLEYRTSKRIIQNTKPKETTNMAFDLSNYVDVATRVKLLLEKYPNASIACARPVIVEIDNHYFIEVTAKIDCNDGSGRVAQASAWEPFPGKSAFTKDSEAMNSETSAVGRACGLLGFGLNGSLASSNEVQNRQAAPTPAPVQRKDADGKPLPLQIKGTQHGAIPQWALDAAAEQGIVLAYDNRDTLVNNPKRPWFKCVESGAPIWAPKGTPLPDINRVYDVQDEEPF